MVMMHELAHCKQMNHSKVFWQERNKFAESMQGLWQKKYTGEGMWGRGQNLDSGVFVHDRMPDTADIPEHLCGGTYRRGRGRKRKRGQNGEERPKVTYAERQQKRIQKKFGKHGDGHDLGEDELVRGGLEQGGKRHYGKPKVANSKRGRELRANAALARFEAAKVQQQVPELDEDDGSETETESDDEFGDSLPILEKLGQLTDEHRRFFKIDEDGEDDGGEGAKDELKDLVYLGTKIRETTFSAPSRKSNDNDTMPDIQQDDSESLYGDADAEDEQDVLRSRRRFASRLKPSKPDEAGPSAVNGATKGKMTEQQDDSETDDELDLDAPPRPKARASNQSKTGFLDDSGDVPTNPNNAKSNGDLAKPSENNDQVVDEAAAETLVKNSFACPICSLDNAPDAVTCMVCSHVLKPKLMASSWRCKSEQCKGSNYINIGDNGVCTLCGSKKPAIESKPMGVTSADTLRWD